MPNSADDYSQQMRAQLKILDPDMSAEPGTPERKLIDTVAETLAEAQSDQFVLNYQLDIDSKSGTDLDKFVALFGFARQGGTRATGTVTFSLSATSTQDILIPVATAVVVPASSITPQITFYTQTTVILYNGTLSVDAPVEAADIGTSGNVAANAITLLGGSASSQITSVNNIVATSGGSDLETDAELRIRFKNTIFRNISGTPSQYLALALADQYTNKAKVIGPIDRFIEYIQIPTNVSGIASQIPYSKYTYNFDYYVTQNSSLTGNQEIFFQPNVDYVFTGTVPPKLTIVIPNPSNDFTVGSVVLFEHSYCSVNSRNDPANNIMNYVDLYISGDNDQTATDSVVMPATANNFNSSTSSAYYVGNYKRATTNLNPTTNNRFMPLLWQPVVDVQDSIIVNGVTYIQGVDYWLVTDQTTLKGSKRARNGLEWSAAAATTVGSGTNFQVNYTFNKLPLTINELADAHKQVTADILVHAATKRYFNINLIVMYTTGFSRSTVDSSLTIALTNFLNRLQFGAIIQISDLLEIAHEVNGVDNVRLAAPSDNVPYGIQEVAADGTTPLGLPNTNDFSLLDSDLPVVNQVNTTRRSQNTWSTNT